MFVYLCVGLGDLSRTCPTSHPLWRGLVISSITKVLPSRAWDKEINIGAANNIQLKLRCVTSQSKVRRIRKALLNLFFPLLGVRCKRLFYLINLSRFHKGSVITWRIIAFSTLNDKSNELAGVHWLDRDWKKYKTSGNWIPAMFAILMKWYSLKSNWFHHMTFAGLEKQRYIIYSISIQFIPIFRADLLTEQVSNMRVPFVKLITALGNTHLSTIHIAAAAW